MNHECATNVRKFIKLRAIWAILRNGSVIWNAGITGNAVITTDCRKTGWGVVLVHNVYFNGFQVGADGMRCRK